MKMYTLGFNRVSELNDYINDHGIQKEDIVNILQSAEGTWLLMYYGK